MGPVESGVLHADRNDVLSRELIRRLSCDRHRYVDWKKRHVRSNGGVDGGLHLDLSAVRQRSGKIDHALLLGQQRAKHLGGCLKRGYLLVGVESSSGIRSHPLNLTRQQIAIAGEILNDLEMPAVPDHEGHKIEFPLPADKVGRESLCARLRIRRQPA